MSGEITTVILDPAYRLVPRSLAISSPTRRHILAGAGAGLALSACTRGADATEAITVFAAASLTDALGVVAEAYQRRTGRTVRLSFASSGAVARQIQAGAPADIVVLADETWMDRLRDGENLANGSRRDLLTNRLVLIGRRMDRQPTDDPFAALLEGQGRLVIGDPESVPAGAYAKAWLEQRGMWNRLVSRLVMAADVRAVRGFVIRGEAEYGLVYRSDAVLTPEVEILLDPPDREQPRIIYPAALTAWAKPGSMDLLNDLQASEARAVFERHGFGMAA